MLNAGVKNIFSDDPDLKAEAWAERRALMNQKREEYKGDELALQQIDKYDWESPYHRMHDEADKLWETGERGKAVALRGQIRKRYALLETYMEDIFNQDRERRNRN